LQGDSELYPGAKEIMLRAHHLLCIHVFVGEGYSPEFSDNMKRVVEALKSPSQQVKVIRRVDDICAFCPHVTGNYCSRDNQGVLEMDGRVLATLRIEAGSVFSSSYLKTRIKEALIDRLPFDVCVGCRWFDSHCRGKFADAC